MRWEFTQEYEMYTDYDMYLDVGDDGLYCNLRATWDSKLNYGYVGFFATADGGDTELVQFDFPARLTREEFSRLTGHNFEEAE